VFWQRQPPRLGDERGGANPIRTFGRAYLFKRQGGDDVRYRLSGMGNHREGGGLGGEAIDFFIGGFYFLGANNFRSFFIL